MSITLAGIAATLGTIAVITAAVRQIVNDCEAIMEDVNGILGEVNELLDTLSAESDGEFKDAVVNATNWMKEKFRDLIAALAAILNAIRNAMDENERVDAERAGALSAATGR
jgi:uncharacterized protein YukE